jgi:cytochrome c oxidase subunit 3
LGIVFLLLQCLLWSRLWAAGLRIDGGPYPSVFWALTVFHALHVLAGLGGLCYVAARGSRGLYGPSRHVALRLWSGFWHFVGAVWAALYLAVFVI